MLALALLAGPGFALAQTEWRDHQQVVPAPDPRARDSERLTSTVLEVDGTYHMCFSGGTSSPSTPLYWDWGIGHATSVDGLDWGRDPNPVLAASEPWEGNKVYYPTVVRSGDRFAMAYAGHNGAIAALGYAESPDGLVWTKWPGNPVLTPLSGCNQVDSSAVIFDGDTAHGWVGNCDDIRDATSPLELVFFDGFESGDTTIWSLVVP